MHNCSACGRCAQSLALTQGELHILDALAQIPFLPIYRKIDDVSPIYLEDNLHSQEEYSLILQHLEAKSLISLDFDKPLGDSASAQYPICGSMALTARGQSVVELLERQGFLEEE